MNARGHVYESMVLVAAAAALAGVVWQTRRLNARHTRTEPQIPVPLLDVPAAVLPKAVLPDGIALTATAATQVQGVATPKKNPKLKPKAAKVPKAPKEQRRRRKEPMDG